MVICRNCRSSLPDGSTSCNVCGYQIDAMPAAPFYGVNATYNAPSYPGTSNTEDEERRVPPVGMAPWGATEAFPYPTHGNHQQPLSMHGNHQQPLSMHGNHQQPLYPQPQHQQMQSSYGSHHQPQGMHAPHQQPEAKYANHLKKILNGGRPSFLTIAVSSLIVVGVTAIILLVIQLSSDAKKNATPKFIASDATLVSSGKAVPGQMLQVVGNRFIAGQTVYVTIDNQPLAYTSHSSVLKLSIVSGSFANLGGTPVKVRTDGTFTVAVPVDTHWTVGSTHHVSVNDQQGKELKSLNFVVETNQAAGVAATGTIQIMNNNRQSPLSLPAGKILTNTAGCTGKGLQISLNSAVNLGAYSGTGDRPTTTVPVQVVQPGAAGNIQDCDGSGGGYAFEYCEPSCDSTVSWTAFNINGGFTGGTGPQAPTAVQQGEREKARSFITVLLYKREYTVGYNICPYRTDYNRSAHY